MKRFLALLAAMCLLSACGTTTKEPTYEEYLNMSGQEQQAWFESFEDPEAFFAWYDQGKAAYDAAQDKVEIGEDGTVDMSEIAGEEP